MGNVLGFGEVYHLWKFSVFAGRIAKKIVQDPPNAAAKCSIPLCEGGLSYELMVHRLNNLQLG